MKFVAINLLSFGLIWAQPLVGATVNCSEPPGGTINCPSGLAAICVVDKGRVKGKCVAPPESAAPAEMREFAERALGQQSLTGWSQYEIERALSGEEVSIPNEDINIRIAIPEGSVEGLR